MKKGLVFFFSAVILYLIAERFIVQPLNGASVCIKQITSTQVPLLKNLTASKIEKEGFCVEDKTVVDSYISCLSDVRQDSLINPDLFFKLSRNKFSSIKSTISRHNEMCQEYSDTLIE